MAYKPHVEILVYETFFPELHRRREDVSEGLYLIGLAYSEKIDSYLSSCKPAELTITRRQSGRGTKLSSETQTRVSQYAFTAPLQYPVVQCASKTEQTKVKTGLVNQR